MMYVQSLAFILAAHASLSCVAVAAGATVTVVPSAVVHRVDPNYVSFNFDWHLDTEEPPAWVNSSVLNLPLDSPALQALAAALAADQGAYLRIGGSEGDMVWYDMPDMPCPFNTSFCLTMDRWQAVNAFAEVVGVDIFFGLNAMQGRNSSGSAPSKQHWNASNAAAFLRYNAAQNFSRLRAYSYGNELEDKIDPVVYAADVLEARALIDSAYGNNNNILLVANDENPSPSYWATFLPLAGASLSAATWHLYIGYGLDPALPSQAWNASFLADIDTQAAGMLVAAHHAAPQLPLWIGETALAWHSGQNGTTNSFASGPWYISQLGKLALTHTVQCRQTLVGGWYDLIDRPTLMPNPDYFTALLWKRTMGTGVLSASSDDAGVAAYAHCAAAGAGGKGVTLALINFGDQPVTVNVSGLGAGAPVPRQEYLLTPYGGNSSSARQVLLNGAATPLTFDATTNKLSPTPPNVVTDPSQPLVLQPRSYGFVTFPAANSAC